MASKELVERIDEMEKWVAVKGVDDGFLNAYAQLVDYAYTKEDDSDYARKTSANLKRHLNKAVMEQSGGQTIWKLERYAQINKEQYDVVDKLYKLLKYESYYDFVSFMLYMEKNRLFEKRFFQPRIVTLGIVANDLQELEDGKIKFYGLSMPSRVGKSSICLFFLAWVGLRRPGSHNAMGGHSGILAKRFFKGLLNIIDTPEYTYQELFNYYNPKLKKVIENKSAEEFTINLGEPDEFSTYTCRGIDGTWTGAVDVSADGYLYVDDLVRDREHSLSPSRMENTYQEYQNKMLDRMNDGARELMVGTLWNVNDPLERERKQYEGDKTRRFRKIPALDDNEQSNFQYEVKGFSTEYYINMRSRLDQAEWMAKFQQQPFVREGLLFPIENLIYFDGYLPEVNTMRVIAALDPAFGKGDHSSMPICADCGSEGKYIIDWVHDARTPGFTVPIIVDKIVTHHITLLKIEENNGGKLYAEQVQNEMAQRGVNFCKIDLQYAPVKISKEDKIGGYSDYILREFRFIQQTKGFVVDDGVRTMYKRSQQYNNAIDEVCLYSPQAKNPKDDAPDSLTQLAMMFDNTRNRIHQTRVIKGGLL